MSTQVVIAIVGIAGILLGAGAQYLLARRTESAKHFQELRTRSYVDFLKSTAGTVIAQRTQNSEKESEASVLMIDAKARIAIYGSPVSRAERFRTTWAEQNCTTPAVWILVVVANNK